MQSVDIPQVGLLAARAECIKGGGCVKRAQGREATSKITDAKRLDCHSRALLHLAPRNREVIH